MEVRPGMSQPHHPVSPGGSGDGHHPSGRPAADAPRSRRQLLMSGATAFAASVLGVFGLAVGAAAKNGDPLRAGERTHGEPANDHRIEQGTRAPGQGLESGWGGAAWLRQLAGGRRCAGRSLVGEG